MALRVITEPAIEPVTVAEAKQHLRVTGSSDDSYIAGLIERARRFSEDYMGRAIMTQTLKASYDCFPSGREIFLERPKLQSVTSVTYRDSNEQSQTLSGSLYTVDSYLQPARIVLKRGQSYPSLSSEPNAVEIEYVAGYGANPSLVPPDIIQGILYLVSNYYANRESVVVASVSATEVPMTFCNLMFPHKVHY